MKFIGVDGCRIGWFFVSLDDNENWNIGVLSKISGLTELMRDSVLILVDIPIGLRQNEMNERRCDLEARSILGQRRSSVFPVPSRSAINCSTYEKASRINFEHTGRKLSLQSWGIVQKIREMDEFLAKVEAVNKVRETHPEVCFWALNRRVAMKHNKKSQAGFNERLALLSRHCWYAKDIVEAAKEKHRRNAVAADDIIDALAAAVTAKFHPSLGTLPERPERDAEGCRWR